MKYKLICLDMDGVIFEHNNFWMELHRELGTLEEGYELTKKYLKTDYRKLVDEVVGRLWKGKEAGYYYKLVMGAKYNPNAKKFVNKAKRLGYELCIISSGPSGLLDKAMKELGIKKGYSNELVIKDNVITGEFRWLVAYNNKLPLLISICKSLGIKLKEVIAVGDDDNDLETFMRVGFSIAFNTSCEELRNEADAVINSNDLMDVFELIKSKS